MSEQGRLRIYITFCVFLVVIFAITIVGLVAGADGAQPSGVRITGTTTACYTPVKPTAMVCYQRSTLTLFTIPRNGPVRTQSTPSPWSFPSVSTADGQVLRWGSFVIMDTGRNKGGAIQLSGQHGVYFTRGGAAIF